MESIGLYFLPTELLHSLCPFLSERDITALSTTCVRFKGVTNVDQLWERFVTKEVLSLVSQDQQVSPAFTPDLGKCLAQQKLSRKNHLISNWKNGRCVHFFAENEAKDVEQVVFYTEDYVVIGGWFPQSRSHLQLWDIRTSPVLLWKGELRPYDQLFVIEDSLVAYMENDCFVDVYEINVGSKSLPFRYSFSVIGNEITSENQEEPSMNCLHDDNFCRVFGHHCIRVKDLLLFISNRVQNSRSTIHIWDVVNRRKVGEFVLSGLVVGNLHFHSSQDNQVFIEFIHWPTKEFYMFDIVTHQFSLVYITSAWEFINITLLNSQRYITFTRNSTEHSELKVLPCKMTNLTPPYRSKSRFFVNVSEFVYSSYFSIVVSLDRFVIPCSDGFHVVNTTTLNTECIVPHDTSNIRSICPISVFGSLFILTVENEKDISVWDVVQKQCVLTFQPKMFSFGEKTGINIYGKDIKTGFNVYGKDIYGKVSLYMERTPRIKNLWIEGDESRHLCTKCLSVGQNGITVTHFW